MSVGHSDEQTLAVIVYTISIVKKIDKDGQPIWHTDAIRVKKRKSTLAAHGIANIFHHEKNNVYIAL